MTKHARSGFQIVVTMIAALALTGCFTSTTLLKEQRIWDPTWQGRYDVPKGPFSYAVLAADATARTYLIGQFDRDRGELKTFRGALYPGWDDVFILGTLETGFRTTVNYHLVRRVTKDRLDVVVPSCESKKDAKGNDPCAYASIDTLRKALKQVEAAERAKGKPTPIERQKGAPLSSLTPATELATFEDGDGVHGALRIAPNAQRPASMNATDLIIAVNGYESTSGSALQLFIAFEKPGTKLRLTLLDPKTNTRRDIALTTMALAGS